MASDWRLWGWLTQRLRVRVRVRVRVRGCLFDSDGGVRDGCG